MSCDSPVFCDNEFEMAMITYKRASFVRRWLSECIEGIKKYNIQLSIYDSSDNDDTFSVIEQISTEYDYIIRYNRLPSNTTGGYKYIPPILATTCKYIMIVGDSRYHVIDDLANNVFPLIKSGRFDAISLSYFNNEQDEMKEYDCFNDYYYECFIPLTCCGMTIFKTSVFDAIKCNPNELTRYDMLYKGMFGFAYMGYYLEAFAKDSNKAITVKVPWHSINPQRKIQHWNIKFYECWCDELCEIMDRLPNTIQNKDIILKNTWETMKLDGFDDLYLARKAGGLTMIDYRRMVSKGYLQRVTSRTYRFKLMATMPLFLITPVYFIFRCIRKGIRLISWKQGEYL